jgi:hypothetical protein
VALAYTRIRIADRSDNQKALYQSPSRAEQAGGTWAVVGCSFDLKLNEGCNDLTLKIDKAGINGSVLCGYQITVDVFDTAGTSTRYWMGKIVSIQKPGTTSRVWTYKARGLWDDVETQKSVRYYEGAAIDTVVTDILGDIDTPDTLISSSTSEISIASPYVVADIEAEFDSTAEILAQLATMQGDVQYGVDQNGKLYFKDISTADVATFVVGSPLLSSLEVSEDMSQVINDFYLQSKDMAAGGQITYHDSDATSKTAYGRRTKVTQLRNTKSSADAIQYLASIKARDKDPKQRVNTDLGGFTDFIFPRGNVRVLDKDGTAYHFPIQRVKFELDGTRGLTGSLELGDQPQPTLPEQMRNVVRMVERQTSNQMSLTRIEHTRGEEFAQAVLSHSGKDGLLNRYINTMRDEKGFDPARSRHITLSEGFNMGPFDFSNSNLYTIKVPLGIQKDTIRIYTQFDHYGRVNFAHDSDITTFFEGIAGASPLGADNTDDWRANEDGLGLEQFQNGGDRIFYNIRGGDVPVGQTGFRFEGPYKVRFLYKALPGAADVQHFFAEYSVSADEFAFAEIDNTASPGPTSMAITLYKRESGVDSIISTLTGVAGDTDHIFEFSINSIATEITLNVYDVNMILESSSGAKSITWGAFDYRRAGFNRFFSSGTIHARIGWIEIEENATNSDAIIRASRDGGTTMSPSLGQVVAHGFDYHDIDLSAQPAGTDLVVQLYMRHPKRLYGWAAAW